MSDHHEALISVIIRAGCWHLGAAGTWVVLITMLLAALEQENSPLVLLQSAQLNHSVAWDTEPENDLKLKMGNCQMIDTAAQKLTVSTKIIEMTLFIVYRASSIFARLWRANHPQCKLGSDNGIFARLS